MSNDTTHVFRVGDVVRGTLTGTEFKIEKYDYGQFYGTITKNGRNYPASDVGKPWHARPIDLEPVEAAPDPVQTRQPAAVGDATPVSRFEQIAADIGKMTDSKQRAYGDSFGNAGDVLAILYPNGVQPAQYRDMLAVTRVIDKLFRIATDRDALGESPWRDVAGYALLGLAASEAGK